MKERWPVKGRLGILGGTFDPIHIGHLIMAEEVRARLSLQQVVFVPAQVSPLKLGDSSAPPERRLRMVELAIRDNPHFAVSRIDLDRQGPSFTVDTLRAIRGACGADVELFFILIGGVFLMGMISNQPELVNSLNQLTRDISRGQVDVDALTAIFEPFLRHPGVVFLLISGLAVVVPLVEETLKPLGLWFLAKRGFSPAQGFVLGATSGAAFALVESLATLSSVSGEGWMGLALGRAGTALLHITCSGLVGWGLGLAWTRAKYAQLAGLFLLAVAVHGAWNGFAQFLGLMPFINEPALAVQSSGLSETVIVAVLGIILLATALMLFTINRRLNAEQTREEAAALVAQPVSLLGELPYAQAPLDPAAPTTPSLPGEGGEGVPPA